MRGDYSYKTLMEIDNHPSTEQEPPLSDMVGSCNGLVCLWVKQKSSYARDPIYICNPATNEYIYLPAFNNYKKACNGETKGYFHYGFGYHHPTDAYKVVRIYYHDVNDNEYPTIISSSDEYSGQVQAYTLGNGHGWRDIGRLNHDLAYYRSVWANGSLHWIKDGAKEIVAFDLADEEFRLIPFPPLSPDRSNTEVDLQLMFGGYLCVVHIDVGKQDEFIHIWVLEKKKKFSSSYDIRGHDEFNNLWRWSKKFSIPCAKAVTYFHFAVTKSNQVLMSSDRAVFCFDLGTQVLRKLWDNCSMRNSIAIPHVNSLVSLESLGEKSIMRKRQFYPF
ncbi:F-box/kelch-repeat protein At3g06240-like [Papaver somniferum]|uniref:F-box/kelch-repeat protein At3g06240-like n=1 Tax=Papaver somniferum TaxID=3469 RepID=UPI000E6FA6CE|nr:F-box/kelch-repeat protein At3g06240-like [Papaver somniferum]